MSILIKGMEMPKNCENCKIEQECYKDEDGFYNHEGFCPLVNAFTDGVRYKNRLATCPLISVPPHGRLGDLDKLERMFADIDNAPYSGFDGEEPFYSADDAAQIIRLAPTIIPAEEGE